MSLNRIQKLLFSKHCDFEDVVLLESPFAEITRNGLGLRQVQIGLTSSKFILANELLKCVDEYPILYYPNSVDPEIESMELISIFPIELVSLSVWQRRRRKVLKVRYHDGNPNTAPRVAYYELGGLVKRKMFWHLWCEKVRFFTTNMQYGSATEASVGSSTSADSFFVAHTRITGDKIWQYYDSGYRHSTETLGPVAAYLPSTARSSANDLELKTIFEKKSCDNRGNFPPSFYTAKTHQNSVSSRGYWSSRKIGDENNAIINYDFKDFDEFCEQSIYLWSKSHYPQPARVYQLHPCPDLNHCAGILSTDPSGKFSAQIKRSQSLLSVTEERLHILDLEEIRDQNKPVVGSQSFQHVTKQVTSHQLSPDDRILYFWTTDYWYKPDKINRKLAHCRAKKPEEIQKTRKKMFFSRKRTKVCSDFEDIPLIQLRSALKLDNTVSALSLNSESISSQLTIMDVSLFLKIPATEFRIFKSQGNVRNCKNFMTWVIFGHRVSCLTATQILLAPDTKERARLVSRFIFVCDKCHRLSNHQSAASVLMGLQSPAIYRLYATWARVRQHHSTAYRVFKFLSSEYRTATLPDLTKPPFLVSARFFMDTILCKLWPQEQPKSYNESPEMSQRHDQKSLVSTDLDRHNSALQKMMQQIMSVFNIGPNSAPSSSTLAPSVSSIDEASTSSVSVGSPSRLSGLREAEGVLRLCQQAGRKYDLQNHRDAQEYLQKVPYYEHSINFQLSLKIEPPS